MIQTGRAGRETAAVPLIRRFSPDPPPKGRCPDPGTRWLIRHGPVDGVSGTGFPGPGFCGYPETMMSNRSHSRTSGLASVLLFGRPTRGGRTSAVLLASLAATSGLVSGCAADKPSEVILAGSSGAGFSSTVTTGTTPWSTSPPDPSRACPAEQLDASVDSTSAGAGHTFYSIRLTNTGTPCTVSGYPGVSLIDATGNQVGAPADREIGAKGAPVRLNPGTSAVFSTKFSQPYAYNAEACQPTERAQRLKIYPPNDTGWLTVPVSQPTCGSERISTITVTGVSAG